MTLSPAQIQALRELRAVWPDTRIVIIGATALAFHHRRPWWRTTADLDLALALELDDVPGPLDRAPGWRQHARRAHEFTSPLGATIDLLPAGPTALARGQICWPDGNVMSLIGMELAFAHATLHTVTAGFVVQVAPSSVVCVLKMAAYCDRPTERERDLEDIAHLLDAYVDDDDDRRFDEGAGRDFDLVPAYLLGRDVGAVATSGAHRRLIAPNEWRSVDGEIVLH